MSKVAHPFRFPIVGQSTAVPDTGSRKVAFVSLGCSKNQVDSEVMMGNLKRSEIVADAAEADTIVINTCGFIESAKQESIDAILAAVRIKQRAAKRGKVTRVIVAGCLSERYRDELRQEIPEVDALFGVHEFDKVTGAIEGHYQIHLSDRKLLNESHFAYLKISEGCNQRCAFCYIPMMRGNLVSKTMDENVDEARRLADQGVKELILISQDTSSYGYDFDRNADHRKNNVHLIRLLERLNALDGIEWIRILYLYPSVFSDDLIETIAGLPKVCKYVDLPIQHISDRVLKSMRRNTTRVETERVLNKLRERIPDVAVRTSLIAGFPGETETDFGELLEFVMRYRFDRLGVFLYSDEEGTPAYGLADRVPPSIKQERHDRLMEMQREISLETNRSWIGRSVRVLVDRQEGGHWIGRTERDAPEIDNEVVLRNAEARPGRFVDALVDDAAEYELFAKPLTKEPV